MHPGFRLTASVIVVGTIVTARSAPAAAQVAAEAPPRVTLRSLGDDGTMTAATCTARTLGTGIPVDAIGEPVSGVTLAAPQWTAPAGNAPGYCSVDGRMTPVDRSGGTPDINFRVLLPARWSHRAVQLGGGGFNGVIPNLTGQFTLGGDALLRLGFATFGSDSGHQAAFGRRGTPGPPPSPDTWTYSDEAIRNIGYAQMKKTHDAAMVLIERAYGAGPQFTYYAGSSQGGREALTVAQRYPDDYDGVVANVPIVNFSSLMLAPELIRIQEKPLANWVTPAKVETIRAGFMEHCDGLDGRVDGVMSNYQACRAIFDASRGGGQPWASRRCPGGQDPAPDDTSANACLTDGQIDTLRFVYQPYPFATPLAHDVTSFGMWLPNTDPSGSGLIAPTRFRGQEGAGDDARRHSHLGVLGVTGFLMRDVDANPLDYVEGGRWNDRRIELSAWLDSTDPDLSPFADAGGKMIVTIGTNDTLASPGAQLDYYQSVIDRLGREAVDRFARFFVIPQVGHGLSGTNAAVDGQGRTIPTAPLPNAYDRFGVLVDWVENGVVPGQSLTVTAGDQSRPLCSYPTYPRYQSGPPTDASSYTCAEP